MTRVEQIKHVLRRISPDERSLVAAWLRECIDGESDASRVAEPAAAYAETPPPYMTLDEYFEFEERSQLRHEYVNGVVYAMSGASLAHNEISSALLSAFRAHLRGGPCRAFINDVKLRISSASDQIIYYPDLMVACNPSEWGTHFVCNPKLIVEVLSPTTMDIDRREKGMTYRRVDSIEEYVLVEQGQHKVTVNRRAENWTPQMYAGLGAVAEFRSLSLFVPLAQIYEDTLAAAGP